MIITQFEAMNFCQHEHILWDLKPGLTGIYGPVGSGKSNALKAMYLALTNDHRRNDGKKDENIRQGIGKRDKSFVRIVVQHHETEFEVQRNLKPSSSYFHSDAKNLDKDSEILNRRRGILKRIYRVEILISVLF